MIHPSASCLIAIVALGGCGGRRACDEQSWDGGANLQATPLTGSSSFDRVSSQRRTLQLRLSGLPVLWQASSNLFGGSVWYTLSTEYTGEIKGNDGRTEMPRVSSTLTLEGMDMSASLSTGQFASGTVVSYEMLIFYGSTDSDQDTSQTGLCRYGARECLLTFDLAIDRLDGAPFPPVMTSWTIQAKANVTACPLDDGSQLKLEFREVEP